MGRVTLTQPLRCAIAPISLRRLHGCRVSCALGVCSASDRSSLAGGLLLERACRDGSQTSNSMMPCPSAYRATISLSKRVTSVILFATSAAHLERSSTVSPSAIISAQMMFRCELGRTWSLPAARIRHLFFPYSYHADFSCCRSPPRGRSDLRLGSRSGNREIGRAHV